MSVNWSTVQTDGSWQQIVPYNGRRVCLVVSVGVPVALAAFLSPSPISNIGVVPGIFFATTDGKIELDVERHGILVCYPWFSSTLTSPMVIETMAANYLDGEEVLTSAVDEMARRSKIVKAQSALRSAAQINPSQVRRLLGKNYSQTRIRSGSRP